MLGTSTFWMTAGLSRGSWVFGSMVRGPLVTFRFLVVARASAIFVPSVVRARLMASTIMSRASWAMTGFGRTGSAP